MWDKCIVYVELINRIRIWKSLGFAYNEFGYKEHPTQMSRFFASFQEGHAR